MTIRPTTLTAPDRDELLRRFDMITSVGLPDLTAELDGEVAGSSL